jgi:hypothetical protein
VVAISDETRAVLVGQCKWSANPADKSALEDLYRVTHNLQEEGEWRQMCFALFSRSGFTPALRDLAGRDGVILVEPKDLVGD